MENSQQKKKKHKVPENRQQGDGNTKIAVWFIAEVIGGVSESP